MFLHWTGAGITGGRAYEINSVSSQGTAELLTTQSKYDSYSANVRGAGYVKYYALPDFVIGSEDFAIEFWYYLDEVPPYSIPILAQAPSVSLTQPGTIAYQDPQTPQWLFTQIDDGTFQADFASGALATSSLSLGQWYHMVLSRTGTTVALFQDGSRVGHTTDSNTYGGDTSHIFFVGFSKDAPNDSAPGYYIDGFRYTIGSDAGYDATTTSFTTPASMPGSVSGETRLRLNFENTWDDIL